MTNFTNKKIAKRLTQEWQKAVDQCRYYNDRYVNSESIDLDTLFNQETSEVHSKEEQKEQKENWLEELRKALDE